MHAKTKIIWQRKEKHGGNKVLVIYDYLIPLSAEYGNVKYVGEYFEVMSTVWDADTHTLEIYVEK